MIRHVPNTLTSLNLLCGSVAVADVLGPNPNQAAWLLLAAAAFDFFDGFAARALKVQSAIGKDLDSLADMVSFGLVPGLIMARLLMRTVGVDVLDVNTLIEFPVLAIPFAIPVFSALRLAKFNNDPRQSEGFRGVPTPASALWCVGILLSSWEVSATGSELIQGIITSQFFIVGSCIALCLLMVSDLPLIALKFKKFAWGGNEYRFVLIGLCLAAMVTLGAVGILVSLTAYILLSLVQNFTAKTP